MRTPSGGPGTNQYSAVNPEGGHPHIVEGVITPVQSLTDFYVGFCFPMDIILIPVAVAGIFVGF